MKSHGNLHVSVPAGPRAAAAALAAAREFLDGSGCDADMRAHLAIIVEELVLNIVEHGMAPDGDVIEIGFASSERGVRLTIVDGGAHFDPRSAPQPGERPPERGGGAGLALVHAWADILSYERRDGRNHLLLDVRA